ncbi:hypothetical protein EPO66_04055 [bacterium]|nr:MAG: hypothetical protein EPO66_04055 [bacterium]
MKYFVVLAISMFLFSCAAFAQDMEGGMQDMPKKQMMQQGRRQMQNPEEMIEKRIEMLTKRFNLTAEQQAKVKEILTASGAEAKAIAQEVQQKIKEIRERDKQAIDAILTDEQKAGAKEQRQGGGQGMPVHEGMPQETGY